MPSTFRECVFEDMPAYKHISHQKIEKISEEGESSEEGKGKIVDV